MFKIQYNGIDKKPCQEEQICSTTIDKEPKNIVYSGTNFKDKDEKMYLVMRSPGKPTERAWRKNDANSCLQGEY